MPPLIDIADVQAAMAAFKETQRARAEDPEMGTVFRAQLAVTPELTIWRATELNRGTSQNTILNAVVMLIAATIAGEAMAAGEGDIDEQFGILNRTLQAIAEETANILTNPNSGIVSQKFDFVNGGRA